MIRTLAVTLALLSALVPRTGHAGEVTVFAAASLVDVLTEIASDWEDETGHHVILSFAATSALARQIERGAPADVFVPADPLWLEELGPGVAGETAVIARNTLVIVGTGPDGPAEAGPPDETLLGALGGRPLAMALTDVVPAGRYGRAGLTALGLWDGLAVAETANVRAALALVASGATPLGVVYASDAAATGRVHIAARFPEGSHAPITYPAVRLSDGQGDAAAADAFFEHLASDAAQASFVKWGFGLP